MFERFVQGEAGDRRRFGGIGLGLYIVRQLAHAQDGEVAAEDRDGPGTTMRLRLRCAGSEPDASAADAGAADADAPSDRVTDDRVTDDRAADDCAADDWDPADTSPAGLRP